jgi:hypothetical protein
MKLTVRDAAKLLDTSESGVPRWISVRRASLSTRVNNSFRFHRSELFEWATSRGIRVASREFHVEEENDTSLLRFADALETGGVHNGIPGTDCADQAARYLGVGNAKEGAREGGHDDSSGRKDAD